MIIGGMEMFNNKLGINNEIELSKEEEKITKLRALELFDSKKINEFEVGTTNGLCMIHKYLFQTIILGIYHYHRYAYQFSAYLSA